MLSSAFHILGAIATIAATTTTTVSALPASQRYDMYYGASDPFPAQGDLVPYNELERLLENMPQIADFARHDAPSKASGRSSSASFLEQMQAAVNFPFARDRYARDLAAQQTPEARGARIRRQTETTCLDSSANDTTINALFYYGGAGTVVSLCPGATIDITAPIFMYAANQELNTLGEWLLVAVLPSEADHGSTGYPTGSDRALITVTGDDQSCALYVACDKCQDIAIRNVQIAGSRDTMGIIYGGIGLIEMGGNTAGQIVDNW